MQPNTYIYLHVHVYMYIHIYKHIYTHSDNHKGIGGLGRGGIRLVLRTNRRNRKRPRDGRDHTFEGNRRKS